MRTKDADVYWGIGASPGHAIGPARVLRAMDPLMDLPSKSILVARIIHPHLAPLMARVAGIVVEEGALLQHATVLAREFNLPAVIGVGRATELLDDWDTI